MSRRRPKNSVLPKMIGIAVLINVILLPILAQLGVFKGAKGQRLTQVTMVKLPPVEKRNEEKKAAKPKAKPRQAARKADTHPGSSHPLPPNPNQPKVVAAGTPTTDDNGPEIANNGTGQAGVVPVAPAPAPAPAAPVEAVPLKPAPVPTTVAAAQSPPLATVEPVKPAPPPHVPVVVAAAPVNRVEFNVPDDTSETDLSKPYLALFTVHADGTAIVKPIETTGNDHIDRLAFDAAKRWTFRPATVDGKPVESYLRLRVEFAVTE